MFRLFTHRGFMGVIVAQFFAALNDNAMRQAFLLLAVTSSKTELQATATAVFALPFLLFSLLAGQLADRFSKRTVIIAVKTAEIGIVLMGGYALYLQSLPLLLASILLMATQSTFFSPAKYGILPEILNDKDLSSGNSILQSTTYGAILIGTASAGLLLQFGSPMYLGAALIGFGAIGWVGSLFVDSVPATSSSAMRVNPLSELAEELTRIRQDATLSLALLGYAYAWLVGTILILNLNVYGLKTLGMGQAMTSLMLVFLATGMAVGSLLAGRWTERTVEPGLIPFGATGMAASLLVFVNAHLGAVSAAFWLTMVGVFSGLYLIPLQTMLQERPDEGDVGSTFGVANVVTFSAVMTAAAIYGRLAASGVNPELIMGVLAGSTLAVAVLIVTIIPAFFARFVVWLLTHTIYRIDVTGDEHIPYEGPAILAPNHVSYIDGLLIAACVPRFTRFIVYGPLFDVPILGTILRMANAIPVHPGDDEQIERAMQEAEDALNDGHVLCIFPEGAVTRTGQMRSVKRGVERLARSTDTPVVPVRLDQLWGSVFSHRRPVWKLPERLPYPANVAFGEPIPPGEVTRTTVREALEDVGVQARRTEARQARSLIEKIAHTAHRHPFTSAFSDARKKKSLTFFGLLARALTLAEAMPAKLNGQRVGLYMDDQLSVMVLNLALNINRAVAVNLPGDHLAERVGEAEVQWLYTDDTPDTALRSKLDCEVRTLSTLIDEVGFIEQAKGRLLAACPTRLLRTIYDLPDNDQTLTILYTRGRTGDEKPVRLSGRSVLATIQSIQSVLSLEAGHPVVTGLPLHRSLGYVTGVYLPLLTGSGIIRPHPKQPFEDAAASTAVIDTPERYQSWLKTDVSPPDDPAHLITGGDPVPEALEKQVMEEWGQPLLVGYGCTEAGSVATLNTPDATRGDTVTQQGRKPGSVGRSIPGAAVKITDEEGNSQPTGEEGRILLRSAGFMDGYATNEQPSTEDGWFVTNDRGYLDDDGFLHWTGRT